MAGGEGERVLTSLKQIVTIDGKDVDEPLIHPDELFGEEHVSAGPVSNEGEGWSMRKYCFAPIRVGKFSYSPLCVIKRPLTQDRGSQRRDSA